MYTTYTVFCKKICISFSQQLHTIKVFPQAGYHYRCFVILEPVIINYEVCKSDNNNFIQLTSVTESMVSGTLLRMSLIISRLPESTAR